MENLTIWFIGLHCSGKTTIANKLAKMLRKSTPLIVLDGDEIRQIISSDLGYTLEERNAHMSRVADLCRIINENGILCMACVASPTKESRNFAKRVLDKIITIYTKCPIEVCEQRDVKGHYKKARNKEKGFENFLGVNLEFEEPEDADLVLETDRESPDESAKKVFEHLKKMV